MTRYELLTDTELDGLLMLSYCPGKRERLNLSNRDLFINTIVSRIEVNDMIEEYSEHLIYFLQKTNKEFKTSNIPYLSVIADVRILKMAALMTFDEFKEFIK